MLVEITKERPWESGDRVIGHDNLLKRLSELYIRFGVGVAGITMRTEMNAWRITAKTLGNAVRVRLRV